MTREEMILSKVQYWGTHLGDHMFGTHERPEDDADAYRASRFVVNAIYSDGKEVRLIGLSYGHDGQGKGREKNTTSVLPKRFTQLLKLVAFPEIIE
jgi:hypothetical protein